MEPLEGHPAMPETLTLTVPEAARALGISRGQAYQAAQQGEIPVIRIGRRLLVPKAALLKMVNQAGQAPSGETEAA